MRKRNRLRRGLRRWANRLLIRARLRKSTCLNCGFLALGDAEVSEASRAELAARGMAGGPSLDQLRCSRSLWVAYDLAYAETDVEGVYKELLEEDRRCCRGFMWHRPGFPPSEHRDLVLRKLDSWQKLLFAVLGAALALLVQWADKLLEL